MEKSGEEKEVTNTTVSHGKSNEQLMEAHSTLLEQSQAAWQTYLKAQGAVEVLHQLIQWPKEVANDS